MTLSRILLRTYPWDLTSLRSIRIVSADNQWKLYYIILTLSGHLLNSRDSHYDVIKIIVIWAINRSLQHKIASQFELWHLLVGFLYYAWTTWTNGCQLNTVIGIWNISISIGFFIRCFLNYCLGYDGSSFKF